jgi:hypothetical protein
MHIKNRLPNKYKKFPYIGFCLFNILNLQLAYKGSAEASACNETTLTKVWLEKEVSFLKVESWTKLAEHVEFRPEFQSEYRKETPKEVVEETVEVELID